MGLRSGRRGGDIFERYSDASFGGVISLFDSYFRLAFLYPTYKRRILEIGAEYKSRMTWILNRPCSEFIYANSLNRPIYIVAVDLYHGVCKLRALSPTVLFWDLTNPVRGHGPARVWWSASRFSPRRSIHRHGQVSTSRKFFEKYPVIRCRFTRTCMRMYILYICIYNLGHFIVHLRFETLALPSSIRIRQSRVLFAIHWK